MKADRAFARWYGHPDAAARWAAAGAGSAEAMGLVGAWLAASGLSWPGVPVAQGTARKARGRPLCALTEQELAAGRACAELIDVHGLSARHIERATPAQFVAEGDQVFWHMARRPAVLVTPEISACLRQITKLNRAPGEAVVFLTKASPTSDRPLSRGRLLHLADRARQHKEVAQNVA